MTFNQFGKWCYLFAVLADLALPNYAFAKSNDLPVACKSDGGKTWYFSIGRVVFELNDYAVAKQFMQINDIDPEFRLAAPNPLSPLGCRDNPQQLNHFYTGGWLGLPIYGHGDDVPGRTTDVTLDRPLSRDRHFPNIDSVILLWQDTLSNCDNKNFLTRWNDGTILCSNQDDPEGSMLNLPATDSTGRGWEFIISGNLYLTPLGQQLVVNSADGVGVSVTYMLAPNVVINYRWHVPGMAAQIDTGYVIEVQRAFANALQAYSVLDYAWRDHASDNSK